MLIQFEPFGGIAICYPVLLMGQRTRIRGRGVLDYEGHRLHGMKCFILQKLPGDLLSCC